LTRSTRVTWQSGKKRGLHQGQIESLASLVINLVQEADSLSTADERASPIVAVELGAGKALLGRVVADLLGDAAAVVAVERRAVPIINFDAKAIGKSKATGLPENSDGDNKVDDGRNVDDDVSGDFDDEIENKESAGKEEGCGRAADAVGAGGHFGEPLSAPSERGVIRLACDLVTLRLSEVAERALETVLGAQHASAETQALSIADSSADGIKATADAAASSADSGAVLPSRRVVVFAKHLCAGGSCGALQLVAAAVKEEVAERLATTEANEVTVVPPAGAAASATPATAQGVMRSAARIEGVILAPCCHPQLAWDDLCNPIGLEEQVANPDKNHKSKIRYIRQSGIWETDEGILRLLVEEKDRLLLVVRLDEDVGALRHVMNDGA
jgi:hypothetical protein